MCCCLRSPPPDGESNCPRSESAVHAEFGPGLVYGRFQEAWNARCPDIWNARQEAEAGIPLFIHGGAKGIDAYTVAAFLMWVSDCVLPPLDTIGTPTAHLWAVPRIPLRNSELSHPQ